LAVWRLGNVLRYGQSRVRIVGCSRGQPTPTPASSMPVQVSCDGLAPSSRRVRISRDAHLIAYYGEELPVLVLCGWCCHCDVSGEAAGREVGAWLLLLLLKLGWSSRAPSSWAGPGGPVR
jgi:hypothetical protein